MQDLSELVRTRISKELRRTLLREYYGAKGLLGGDTSQFGEATALRRLVDRRIPNLFVDVGAYDGRIYSVSLPFIRRGWKAILIEPHPIIFRLLSQLHRGNSRVRCINMACSDRHGEMQLFVSADGDTGQEGTLCTDDNDLFNARRGTQTISVQVDTLSTVLALAGAGGTIGILSIDAEGLDYEVLCGLDFKRFAPHYIITEDYPLNTAKHTSKLELLRARGYRLVSTLGCNGIWERGMRATAP